MKIRQIRFISAVLAGFVGLSSAQESPDIEFKRVSVFGEFDNGQIIKGKTSFTENSPAVQSREFNGDFFQRMGVWVTQEAVVRDRLQLIMGVGGVFWYSTPQNPEVTATKQTQFGPGISQAQAIYTFGDLESPTARLQMGLFPYKYNSDAKNLGEYLLRSGTYPGYIVTGGWNMMNSAGYMAQGLRLNVPLWDGKFQSDLLLTMERDLPPLFSLTPTYVATVTPVPGVRLGAGAACNHCLSVKPSAESPRDQDGNNYVITGVDSTGAYIRSTSERYTFQGVKVTATAAFDPKAYVPMSFLGPEDLKIYGEIAVLGWKNYGYLYEKRTERMPVMMGVNLPAFKLLDVLSLEVQHYDSPFMNDFSQVLYGGLPIWNLPNLQDPTAVAAYEAAAKRDNWKWSVYAKKEVTKGINIYAQAASDHFRPIHMLEGILPMMVPVTNGNGKEWYYIVRVSFGI
jgi:hypothetical protein